MKESSFHSVVAFVNMLLVWCMFVRVS